MLNPMSQIMKMVSASLPDDLKPTNVVAEFVAEQFDTMFQGNDDIGVIKLLAVQFSNADPNVVLNKMVCFANAVGVLVQKISEDAAENMEEPDDSSNME